MTTLQQSTLLEVLKKKMRSMKEELEVAKEAAEEAQARLQEEIRRREEVDGILCKYPEVYLWDEEYSRISSALDSGVTRTPLHHGGGSPNILLFTTGLRKCLACGRY
ncbi:hypothetical protein TNCV_2548351 [Trichonephila clavipes]|nr:hypothetical protein TNCV_2548351 [Trichonephila clavipes]